MLPAVLHISCYLVGENSSCSKALGMLSPAMAATGQCLGSTDGVLGGLYPSCLKSIPAERCAKPLEGVEFPGIISGLLWFRIFSLCMSSFEWNDFWCIE